MSARQGVSLTHDIYILLLHSSHVSVMKLLSHNIVCPLGIKLSAAVEYYYYLPRCIRVVCLNFILQLFLESRSRHITWISIHSFNFKHCYLSPALFSPFRRSLNDHEAFSSSGTLWSS